MTVLFHFLLMIKHILKTPYCFYYFHFSMRCYGCYIVLWKLLLQVINNNYTFRQNCLLRQLDKLISDAKRLLSSGLKFKSWFLSWWWTSHIAKFFRSWNSAKKKNNNNLQYLTNSETKTPHPIINAACKYLGQFLVESFGVASLPTSCNIE